MGVRLVAGPAPDTKLTPIFMRDVYRLLHLSLFRCGLPRGSDNFGAMQVSFFLTISFALGFLYLGRRGVSLIADCRSAILTQAVSYIPGLIVLLRTFHAGLQRFDLVLDTLWYPGLRGVSHQATLLGAPVLRVVSFQSVPFFLIDHRGDQLNCQRCFPE